MLVPFSNTAIVSNDASDANSYRCVHMRRKRIMISPLLLYSITKSNRTRSYIAMITDLCYTYRRPSGLAMLQQFMVVKYVLILKYQVAQIAFPSAN
jgi:hypothetical protein